MTLRKVPNQHSVVIGPDDISSEKDILGKYIIRSHFCTESPYISNIFFKKCPTQMRPNSSGGKTLNSKEVICEQPGDPVGVDSSPSTNSKVGLVDSLFSYANCSCCYKVELSNPRLDTMAIPKQMTPMYRV